MRIRFDSRLAAAAVATLLAATASRAQAQDAVITGRVTGEQGRPLAGATVLIPQLSAGTNTNESGTYTITIAASRVSGQTVVMTARMVGHAPARRTITISAGTQTVDLALVHQPVQLNEVVVTGTAEAVEQRKVGFAVGVVNAEQLKEVPATSAAGALAGKVGGAQVLQSAGDPGEYPESEVEGHRLIAHGLLTAAGQQRPGGLGCISRPRGSRKSGHWCMSR